MKTIPRILKGSRRWLMAQLMANGALQAGVMIATAWLVKTTFDGFITPAADGASLSLLWCGAGLAAAGIAIAWLRMKERIDAERMGQDYTHEVRIGLFTHMNLLPPRLLQQRSRGGVMLRFIGDLNALKQWVSLGVARLTVAGVTTAITLIMLTLISGPLALTVSAALAAGALAAWALGQWMQRAMREARRRRARLAGNVSEKIASVAVVQAFGQSRREQRRFERQSEELSAAMIKRARAEGAFRGTVELVAAAASGGALLVGAALVITGGTTPGTVVAVMSIVGLLVPALRDLGRVQEYWHGAVVSREKITDFLDLPTLEADANAVTALPPGGGELRFEDVRVAGSQPPGFSACAGAGQVVALVGPNGAGKSTLLSLAARLLDPEHGRVCLDGHDIRHLEPGSLRRAIGIMTPDLPLLRGSIQRNLSYRWPRAPEQALAEARALCGVDDILATLPRGSNTWIAEEGANLSLGQRQRIALARALLGNPRLLLLDEVDANLDPGAATILGRVLAEYPGTILLATHRLDWARLADQVWHIENGRLVEAGPLSALLAANGPTARLFQRPKAVSIKEGANR
ncbi:MAG: ABC transporter ATP-binding protein [Pseudomonadota bacterium]